MPERSSRLFPALALAAVSVVAAGAVAATAGADPPGAEGFEVVASGLDNPRDLAFADDGALYVAEAGTGGDGACFAGPGGAPALGGATGGVTRVHEGRQRRVVSGLPSSAETGGAAAIGAHGIAFRGRRAVLTIGLRADPAARAKGCGPLGRSFGSLLALGPGRGSVLDVRAGRAVDLSAHEAVANPDGGVPDSNPYGVLATPEGSFVADAGANALLYVTRKGVVSTVATFPSRASGRATDAVPTSVVRGHGALYVGELTGFPFAKGAANVYSVVPGERPRVHLEGFTAVIDLAAGEHGDLFVLEAATQDGLQGPGRLIRVGRDGARTTLAERGLVSPTAVAIGPDGAAYVANCGIFPGAGPFPCSGHVIRIPGADGS